MQLKTRLIGGIILTILTFIVMTNINFGQGQLPDMPIFAKLMLAAVTGFAIILVIHIATDPEVQARRQERRRKAHEMQEHAYHRRIGELKAEQEMRARKF